MVHGFGRKITRKRCFLSIDLRKTFEALIPLNGQPYQYLGIYGLLPRSMHHCPQLHLNCILLNFSWMVPYTLLYQSKRNKTREFQISILFDMIMDNPSRLIEKRVRDNNVNTYKVNGAISISHLLYVDDLSNQLDSSRKIPVLDWWELCYSESVKFSL